MPNTGNIPAVSAKKAALCIALAAGAVYANSFQVPFVLDDLVNIVFSPYVHNLSRLGDLIAPPRQTNIGARPLVHILFALNWAASGDSVWSWHAVNLAIHICAGILVFLLMRQTLSWPGIPEPYAGHAGVLALAVALLWTVHPLNTKSVTYINQRMESLAGLCYLAVVLYALKGWQSASARPWNLMSVLFFAIGVGVKEVIVTAPLMVLLFGWALPGPRALVLSKRWAWLYGGFVLGWMALAVLVLEGGSTRATPEGASAPLLYFFNQPRALWRYLRLAAWPDSLCFYYGWEPLPIKKTLPFALTLAAPLAATVWGLCRRHALALTGAWFFVVLAPTSSILPLPFLIWEHRMYLPLAGVIAFFVLAAFGLGLWLAGPHPARQKAVKAVLCGLALAAMLALGWQTLARNTVYQDTRTLFQDTVKKTPDNVWRRFNAGEALERWGHFDEAIREYREAVRMFPGFDMTHLRLGLALEKAGRVDEAISSMRQAIALNPDSFSANLNLGAALARAGKPDQALSYLQEAAGLAPASPEAWINLGGVLDSLGQPDTALKAFSRALALAPNSFEAHYNLGASLANMGRLDQARLHFQKALALRPGHPAALNALAKLNEAGGR